MDYGTNPSCPIVSPHMVVYARRIYTT